MEKTEKYRILLRARESTAKALYDLSEIACRYKIDEMTEEIKNMKVNDWIKLINKNMSFGSYKATMGLLNEMMEKLSKLKE
jgi:hypothetical protein